MLTTTMEYPQLAGKTIKTATSRIEDNGVAYLELTFIDETSFSFQSTSDTKAWARTYDSDGEVTNEWNAGSRCKDRVRIPAFDSEAKMPH